MPNIEIPKHHYYLVFLHNMIYEQRASAYTLISHESAMTDYFSLTGPCSWSGLVEKVE